jgi:hypothetical protein
MLQHFRDLHKKNDYSFYGEMRLQVKMPRGDNEVRLILRLASGG